MNAGLVVAAAGEQFYFPQTGILLDLKHGNLPTPLPKLVISFPLGEYCQMKMSLHFSSRTMNLQHTSILVWVQTSVLLKPQMLPVPSCTLMEMRSSLPMLVSPSCLRSRYSCSTGSSWIFCRLPEVPETTIPPPRRSCIVAWTSKYHQSS